MQTTTKLIKVMIGVSLFGSGSILISIPKAIAHTKQVAKYTVTVIAPKNADDLLPY
jgi:hypothetical protein